MYENHTAPEVERVMSVVREEEWVVDAVSCSISKEERYAITSRPGEAEMRRTYTG